MDTFTFPPSARQLPPAYSQNHEASGAITQVPQPTTTSSDATHETSNPRPSSSPSPFDLTFTGYDHLTGTDPSLDMGTSTGLVFPPYTTVYPDADVSSKVRADHDLPNVPPSRTSKQVQINPPHQPQTFTTPYVSTHARTRSGLTVNTNLANPSLGDISAALPQTQGGIPISPSVVDIDMPVNSTAGAAGQGLSAWIPFGSYPLAPPPFQAHLDHFNSFPIPQAPYADEAHLLSHSEVQAILRAQGQYMYTLSTASTQYSTITPSIISAGQPFPSPFPSHHSSSSNCGPSPNPTPTRVQLAQPHIHSGIPGTSAPGFGTWGMEPYTGISPMFAGFRASSPTPGGRDMQTPISGTFNSTQPKLGQSVTTPSQMQVQNPPFTPATNATRPGSGLRYSTVLPSVPSVGSPTNRPQPPYSTTQVPTPTTGGDPSSDISQYRPYPSPLPPSTPRSARAHLVNTTRSESASASASLSFRPRSRPYRLNSIGPGTSPFPTTSGGSGSRQGSSPHSSRQGGIVSTSVARPPSVPPVPLFSQSQLALGQMGRDARRTVMDGEGKGGGGRIGLEKRVHPLPLALPFPSPHSYWHSQSQPSAHQRAHYHLTTRHHPPPNTSVGGQGTSSSGMHSADEPFGEVDMGVGAMYGGVEGGEVDMVSCESTSYYDPGGAASVLGDQIPRGGGVGGVDRDKWREMWEAKRRLMNPTQSGHTTHPLNTQNVPQSSGNPELSFMHVDDNDYNPRYRYGRNHHPDPGRRVGYLDVESNKRPRRDRHDVVNDRFHYPLDYRLGRKVTQRYGHGRSGLDPTALGVADAKPARFKPTKEQLEVLVAAYEVNKNPDAFTRERLARELGSGIKPKTLQIWFQNRRSKSRAKEREAAHALNLTSTPTSIDQSHPGQPVRSGSFASTSGRSSVSLSGVGGKVGLSESGWEGLRGLMRLGRDATHTLLPITVISISTWTRFLTPGIAQSSPDLGGAIEFPADPPVPLLCTSAASSTADISPTSHHYHPHHSVPDESVSYRQHSIPFHRHPEPLLHLYVHHTSTTYRLTIPVSARAISDIHTITSTLSGEAGANSHHQHDPNLTQSVAIEFQLKSGMASFSAWCEGGDEDEDESMGEKQARDCNWRAAGAGVGAGVEEKGRDGEEAGDREEDEGGQGRWMPIGDFTGGVAGVGGRCEVTGDREILLPAFARVQELLRSSAPTPQQDHPASPPSASFRAHQDVLATMSLNTFLPAIHPTTLSSYNHQSINPIAPQFTSSGMTSSLSDQGQGVTYHAGNGLGPAEMQVPMTGYGVLQLDRTAEGIVGADVGRGRAFSAPELQLYPPPLAGASTSATAGPSMPWETYLSHMEEIDDMPVSLAEPEGSASNVTVAGRQADQPRVTNSTTCSSLGAETPPFELDYMCRMEEGGSGLMSAGEGEVEREEGVGLWGEEEWML